MMRPNNNEILNLLWSRKIVIYGAGNNCNLVFDFLTHRGIYPELVIDEKEKAGQTYLGYTLSDIDDVRSLDHSAIAIICSGNVEEVFDALSATERIDLILTHDLILDLDNYSCSYSQCGEDKIVSFLFKAMGRSNIKYFDLGANDPIYLSNTFYFYENGSEGVLVEPNTRLTDKAGILRSRDTVLNAGVGPSDGELNYYIMDTDTLNTCSKEDADRFVELGHRILDVKSIPIIGINSLLQDYGRPDFMSLDVEGLDFDIIKTMDFDNYAPSCICIETAEYYGAKRSDFDELNSFFAQKGYMIYGDTFINTIYAQADIIKQYFCK